MSYKILLVLQSHLLHNFRYTVCNNMLDSGYKRLTELLVFLFVMLHSCPNDLKGESSNLSHV